MNEERNENLEVQEGMTEAVTEEAVAKESVAEAVTEKTVTEEPVADELVAEEPMTEEGIEEYIPETVHEESIIDIEAEEQPESVLEQVADGTWRHTEESPFSPFYVPDRKQKKNNRLTIALVAVLLLMLLAGIIFAVSKLVEAAMGEASAAWNESSNAVEEFIAGIKEDMQDEEEPQAPEPQIQEPQLDDKDDYLEDWEAFLKEYEDEYGYEYEEDYDDNYDDYDYYEPSPDDDYYVELADALRDDLSYSVDFEEYTYANDDDNVYISVWYATVSDDLPFADKINEYLEEGAMYSAWAYESENASDLTVDIESFVTYMDEETLSVVVNEQIYQNNEVEYNVYYNLYCMNFDLRTGALLYNTNIIDATEELVQAFRKQSEYQNGFTSSVESYTNEEIKEFMSDEDSLILYYTPVGLEVGYNHSNGWVSVTFKDYQKYLKKL